MLNGILYSIFLPNLTLLQIFVNKENILTPHASELYEEKKKWVFEYLSIFSCLIDKN